ncbi:hypothetical protein NDU88_008429 [Pleurodeles waltl]|uniref:Uncharacterized protein n=1 Tax=Pleurodeles waltl TaxID=8319 RepID=A0AAV7QRR4_PLEWA|nr:hypothetical protein NDU88_008429 [Pleurodeles waltl]
MVLSSELALCITIQAENWGTEMVVIYSVFIDANSKIRRQEVVDSEFGFAEFIPYVCKQQRLLTFTKRPLSRVALVHIALWCKRVV